MLEDFIFIPSIWLGEGRISFSSSSEFIKFYTKWEIYRESPEVMKATQSVEMQAADETVKNLFTFKEIQQTSFVVQLEHPLVGSMSGQGVRSEKTIGWEFRHPPDFEGFEVYEKQENGDFYLHAEYAYPHQFRTIVEGLIWKKEKK